MKTLKWSFILVLVLCGCHTPIRRPVVGRAEIITALHERYVQAEWHRRFVEIEEE